MSIAQYQDLLAKISELQQTVSALQANLADLKRSISPLLQTGIDPVRYSRKDESRRARL